MIRICYNLILVAFIVLVLATSLLLLPSPCSNNEVEVIELSYRP